MSETMATPAPRGPFGKLVRSLSHKRTHSKEKRVHNSTVPAPLAEEEEPVVEEAVPVLVTEASAEPVVGAAIAAPVVAPVVNDASVEEPVTLGVDPKVDEAVPAKTTLFAVDRFKALVGIKPAGAPKSFPPTAWDENTPAPEGELESAPNTIAGPLTTSMTTTPAERTMEKVNANFEHQIQGKRREPSDVDDDAPEPYTFAQKIQALINALPPAAGGSEAPSNPPKRDANGKPIPPPPPPVTNAALCKLLSSASVMNGSISRGRKSVWDVLDHLNVKVPRERKKGDAPPAEDDDSDDEDQSSGIMMYAPLVPLDDSHVVVADSEFVSVGQHGVGQSAEEKILELRGKDPREAGYGDKKSFWPFGKKKTEKEKPVEEEPKPETGCEPRPLPDKKGKGKKEKIPKQVRVWVPSTTQLSAQATWWGYRIYLPPPVLAILSDKTIEATKRAALITTALTWMVNNIPTVMIPPQLQPVAMLLKRLVPYLSYIGVFISWSWSTIKSYDTGHGVIMTATWLLPVALLPNTWEAADVPPSRPPVAEEPKPEDDKCDPPPQCPPAAPAPTTPSTPAPVTPAVPMTPTPAVPGKPTEPAVPVVTEPAPVVQPAPTIGTDPKVDVPTAIVDDQPAVDGPVAVEPATPVAEGQAPSEEGAAPKKKYGFFGF